MHHARQVTYVIVKSLYGNTNLLRADIGTLSGIVALDMTVSGVPGGISSSVSSDGCNATDVCCSEAWV